MLRNRLEELVQHHAPDAKKKDMAAAIGLSRDQYDDWMANKVTRFDSPVVERIMDYFGLEEVSELIVREKNET